MKYFNKTKSANKIYLTIIGALLGTIVFFWIFGYEILNPLFIEWIIASDIDQHQHFIGWHFFRSEPWGFPLGIIRSYPYPQGTSVVYTDSIPFIAILLKLLNQFLPNTFQYKGIWVLLCYILQGVFACLLIRKITERRLIIVIGSLFFVLSPIMLFRVESHESLAAHWVILAALYLYLRKDSFSNKLNWIFLLLLTSAIHAYLLLMVLIIWSGYLLRRSLENFRGNFISNLKFVFSTISILILFMWSIGYFIIDNKYLYFPGNGFWYLSMNLLAFLNPGPYPFLFSKPLPNAFFGQYEGFNYLGLGLLFIINISIFELSRQRGYFVKERDLPLILVCLTLFLYALSNKITFADRVLFEIPLPMFLENAFNVFRSSGRMFWPVTYVLMIASIAIIVKANHFKTASIVLFIAVAIQFLDFYPAYNNISLTDKKWNSPLKSEVWNQLAQKYNHITFIPAHTNDEKDDFIAFSLLAADHGMTLNVGYLSRFNYETTIKYKCELLKNFNIGKLAKDTLYVIRECNLYRQLISNTNAIDELDGYPIIAPGFKKISSKLIYWPYCAEYNPRDVPSQLSKGQTVTIPITLKNYGNIIWTRSGLKKFVLSYHWHSKEKGVIWEGERIILPLDVAPGQTVDLNAILKAPNQKGTYVLKWDMLHDQVAWFSNKGVQTKDYTIIVD